MIFNGSSGSFYQLTVTIKSLLLRHLEANLADKYFKPVSLCFFFVSSVLFGIAASVTRVSLTCALLPVGRGCRNGGGRLDLGREERLHQPPLLQDLRCLRLHTGPGWSHRHGNRRAGLLCHLQGAEEATASGKRSRQGREITGAAHGAHVKICLRQK